MSKPDSFWLDALGIVLLVVLIILCVGEPDLLDASVQRVMSNMCE